MKIVETRRGHLSRRVGPSFADMAIAANADKALPDGWGNYLDQQILRYRMANADYGYPDGWGTSPRRAPSSAKAYKPAHGGYPGTPVLDNAKQAR